MHPAPAGFTFVPGSERAAGDVTHVFGVVRDADRRSLVCKRLGPRGLDEDWMRRRLVAEGELLTLLGGRGAPRLVASGQDAQGPWLAMEAIAWPPLSAHAGRCDARWLESASLAAFDALASVHAAGVVHGDLSPDNVMVSNEGDRAVVVDFGLASAPGMPPMPPGPFRGTLVYAAPEVARGEPFGPPADRFALAASLLRVWSGEPPRAQSSEAAMLLAAGEQSLTGWAERAAAGLPPVIARRLVLSCAFEARDRPP